MSFDTEVFDFNTCTGMNLVQGQNNDIPNSKNGVGKSQLYLSLLYALFGQLQTKIKNENLINRNVKSKDLAVVLEFSVDNINYKVRRSISKGKISALELFRYEQDEYVDITKSTIAETQEFIEKDVIHCDITIFLRTILLTADQTYNFYMLKKADKKEFVEKMFDISVFEEMYKSLHRNVLDYDKESNACQNRLLTLNKTKDDYELQIENYEQNKKERLENLQATCNELNIKLNELKQTDVVVNSKAIAKLEDAADELDCKKTSLLADVNGIANKISQINLGLHKLDESISTRNKIVEKHAALMPKLCDDCKQVFQEHYDLGTISKEIDTFKQKKNVLNESLAEQNAIRSSKNEEYETTTSKLQQLKTQIRDMTAESTKHIQTIATIETKASAINDDIARLSNEQNPYANMLAKCKTNIVTEEKTLLDYDDKLKYLRFAENIVSQETLRKFIIKDLVVLLNNKIKTYLTRLGAQYYVEFDEDMDYEFITHSGSCEWSNFSAGERMRIMIATSFAFRDFMSIRNGLNANILVLDEYFDSAIDTLCVENILSILKDYSVNQNQNIFVISHRPEVGIEQFDRIIKVEKTNGIAHVQYL